MPNRADLSGKRFGRLEVVEYVGNGMWSCKCDCGTMKSVRADHLTGGKTKSCGCLRREFSKKLLTKHGGCGTRLHGVWRGMIARCHRPYSTEYKRYGARGISVCEQWKDFAVFREWAMSSGYREDAPRGECTIDRIDPDGNYCPENCRWVDAFAQANNHRNNAIVVYRGEDYTVTELARAVGMKPATLWARIHNGWTIEDAVERPIRRSIRWHKADA